MPTTNRVYAAKLAFVAAETARTVGEAIRTRRDELHLTQAELADRVENYLVERGKRRPGQPFDAQNISRWERGAHLGTTDNLEALAASLETTMGALMDPGESGSGGGEEPTLRELKEQLDRIERMNAERLPEKDQVGRLEKYQREEIHGHFNEQIEKVKDDLTQILTRLENGLSSNTERVNRVGDENQRKLRWLEEATVVLARSLRELGAGVAGLDRIELGPPAEGESRNAEEGHEDQSPPEAEADDA